MESLVSDIQAWDGKIDYLFYSAFSGRSPPAKLRRTTVRARPLVFDLIVEDMGEDPHLWEIWIFIFMKMGGGGGLI